MKVQDRFNEWTVIGFPDDSKKVECVCACGETRTLWKNNVTSGKSSSCGHGRRVKLPSSGDCFGDWTVESLTGTVAEVTCSCGRHKEVYVYSLLSGDSTSCGHPRLTGPRERVRWMWKWMHSRCYNSGDPMYKYYGGRGVYVVEEWHEDDTYIDWVLAAGFKRSSGMQVDRVDNDGPYSPDNCRVTTAIVNANNKSNNVRHEAWGEVKTCPEWSRDERCEVPLTTLYSRLARGTEWSVEGAITTPKYGKAR